MLLYPHSSSRWVDLSSAFPGSSAFRKAFLPILTPSRFHASVRDSFMYPVSSSNCLDVPTQSLSLPQWTTTCRCCPWLFNIFPGVSLKLLFVSPCPRTHSYSTESLPHTSPACWAPVSALSRFSKPDSDLSILLLAGESSWGAYRIFSRYVICSRQSGRPQRLRNQSGHKPIQTVSRTIIE